jgi:hypothetical protein
MGSFEIAMLGMQVHTVGLMKKSSIRRRKVRAVRRSNKALQAPSNRWRRSKNSKGAGNQSTKEAGAQVHQGSWPGHRMAISIAIKFRQEVTSDV